MATTRIMPPHIGKGRTQSQVVSDIINYVSFGWKNVARRDDKRGQERQFYKNKETENS